MNNKKHFAKYARNITMMLTVKWILGNWLKLFQVEEWNTKGNGKKDKEEIVSWEK